MERFISVLTEIKDSPDEAWRSLQQVMSAHSEHLSIRCDVFPTAGYTKLLHLNAKSGAPAGAGTAFMRDLCRWADEQHEVLVLNTAGKGDLRQKGWKATTSRGRLVKFYGRFGFVPNTGGAKDSPDWGNMFRRPA